MPTTEPIFDSLAFTSPPEKQDSAPANEEAFGDFTEFDAGTSAPKKTVVNENFATPSKPRRK